MCHFLFVCLHPWMEVSLVTRSILSNNQWQAEEKCTKELDSQGKWTKFNFSLDRSSCLPHKAKTYYEMGTDVIIIQTWWGTLYLMEPFNLAHLTTILALWSWFASVFWSPAIWEKWKLHKLRIQLSCGMFADVGLLIYLDKKYCLFQRPLCVTCMLRSLHR